MRQMAVLMLMLSILVSGCAGGGQGPAGPGESNGGKTAPPRHGIGRADAEALVGAYLQDKVEGRFEEAEQRLVPRLHNLGFARLPDWKQWQLVQAIEVEEGWLIETREYGNLASPPTASIARSYYLVVKENGKLYLDLPEVRWGAEKGSPYKTVATSVQPDPKNPERRLVITEQASRVLAEIEPDLPKSFRPFGAPPEAEFGVGGNGWGAVALSPDLQAVAFVTRGTHAFLGLADRSGKVKGLDLWFEGAAGELAWSFDERYLAATNYSPRGLHQLILWDLTTSLPVKVAGLPDGKDASALQWQGGILQVQVGTEPWLVDPSTGQARRKTTQ